MTGISRLDLPGEVRTDRKDSVEIPEEPGRETRHRRLVLRIGVDVAADRVGIRGDAELAPAQQSGVAVIRQHPADHRIEALAIVKSADESAARTMHRGPLVGTEPGSGRAHKTRVVDFNSLHLPGPLLKHVSPVAGQPSERKRHRGHRSHHRDPAADPLQSERLVAEKGAQLRIGRIRKEVGEEQDGTLLFHVISHISAMASSAVRRGDHAVSRLNFALLP